MRLATSKVRASRAWVEGGLRKNQLAEYDMTRRVVVAGRLKSKWTFALYAALTVTVLLPIFSVQVPCLGDYLNHLARISILSRIHATPGLRLFYRSEWKFVPYYGMDLPVLLLSKVFNIYQAGRLFVAACVLMPVVATVSLHYVIHRRYSLVPLTAYLFCYTHMLDRGFLNYLFSSGLAVLLFSGWIATAGLHRLPRVAIFVAGAMLLYLCHAFAFAAYCLLVAGYEVGRSWARRPVSARFILVEWAFAAMPALLTLVAGAILGGNDNVSPGAFIHYGTALDKLGAVLSPFYFPSFGTAGVMASVGTLLLIVICLLLLSRDFIYSPALVGPALMVALACVVTPSVLFNVWGADFRLPLLLVIVLLAGISPSETLSRSRAALILAAVAGLVMLRTIDATLLLRSLDVQVMQMRQLLQALPMGARLLVVDDHGVDQPRRQAPVAMTAHMAMVAVIDRDAFVPFLFTGTSALQLQPQLLASGSTASEAIDMTRLRNGLHTHDPAAGPPVFGWGGHMYWLGWPSKFDFVLVEHFGAAAEPVPDTLARVAGGEIADLYAILPQRE